MALPPAARHGSSRSGPGSRRRGESKPELRIVEAQQALGNDATDSLVSNGVIDSQTSNVEAEVDRLLGNQLTAN